MQMYYSAATRGFYSTEIHGAKMPEDAVAISDTTYKALAGQSVETGPDGYPRLTVQAPNPVAPLVAGLQAHMDGVARTYGYDDIKTAITYRGDPNPKFAAEAEALFEYRSGVWTTAYAYLARVQAGEVSFPTLAEAIAMMPALTL